MVIIAPAVRFAVRVYCTNMIHASFDTRYGYVSRHDFRHIYTGGVGSSPPTPPAVI